MTLTTTPSTTLVEGSQAGEGCGLFAGDVADFAQAQQDGQGCAFPNARNALDQFKPYGEVCVQAYRREDFEEFSCPAALQAGYVRGDEAAQPEVTDLFEADSDMGDILFELPDKGEAIGQRFQSGIDVEFCWIEHRGAGGDEGCVDGVVLGAA